MSNEKRKRTDGIIPTVGGNVPNPMNSTNSPTSDYSYTSKDDLMKKTKINNLK